MPPRLCGNLCSGLLALLLLASEPAVVMATEQIVELPGQTMGTTYHVRVVIPAGEQTESLGEQIEARLAEVNRQMSHYQRDSEISRFNRFEEPDTWFPISAEFAQIVEFSLSLAADTGGAFEPTIGPLVNLWGFGPAKRENPFPSEEELQRLRDAQVIDYTAITVRLDPPALKKARPGIELNLSAVAKGYGVDAVCYELDAAGCPAYMVEIGGEVRTRGHKPNGSPWQIGIEAPPRDGATRELGQIVPLVDAAMATSGDYRNFFEHAGKRYSHTLDPSTGRPVTHQLATVTLQAPTCMQADGWATALLVLGPHAGYDWAREHGVAALLMERTDDGFRSQTTPAWPTSTETSSPVQPDSDQPGSNMSVYVIAVTIFLIAFFGMAIGVILSNRRLKGTCGGLSGMQEGQGKTACELCTNPSPECRGEPQPTQQDEADTPAT